MKKFFAPADHRRTSMTAMPGSKTCSVVRWAKVTTNGNREYARTIPGFTRLRQPRLSPIGTRFARELPLLVADLPTGIISIPPSQRHLPSYAKWNRHISTWVALLG